MNFFGYGRVSTLDQNTQNQKLEIEQAGYKLMSWYEDVGISGSTHATQRPQFNAMLDKIRPGETLVVTKLDRLGRDAHDVGSTIKTLAAMDVQVIVLQLGKLDLASPPGKLMLTMLAAVAEMERDLLVERTQAGLARAKAQGKILGRPLKTAPKERAEIVSRYQQDERVSALARLYGVYRASILAAVKSAS
ncbi:recombinase family protein [Massilia sp. TWR1-2-2]|uniref:recombinase family protein n=1 Tax=Massilia sp. TWR1-2-2 TaxID=2804584 RepID=UPI003CF0D513